MSILDVEFLSIAEIELTEAIQFYNEQSEGLGYKFAGEVRRTLERIVQFPEAWAPLSKRTRRCRTNRFPYGIIYQVRSDNILIIAVMHLHRNPRTWKSRL
ncbi:MAG: type II toxin-antitoxin system RelE/ParE family toxin [bacterium]